MSGGSWVQSPVWPSFLFNRFLVSFMSKCFSSRSIGLRCLVGGSHLALLIIWCNGWYSGNVSICIRV